jgi:single-strand DNA-binding protein
MPGPASRHERRFPASEASIDSSTHRRRPLPDILTLTGLVATTPTHLVTGAGLSITHFRLASSQRRYDRAKQEWVDGETNWYTVTAFRQLATNVINSVQKGQRIVVTGRLKVRDWTAGDKKGTNIELDAEALGHDLSWGTAVFTRSAAAAVADAEEEALASGSGNGAADGDAQPTADDSTASTAAPAGDGEADTFVPAPEREQAAVPTPF